MASGAAPHQIESPHPENAVCGGATKEPRLVHCQESQEVVLESYSTAILADPKLGQKFHQVSQVWECHKVCQRCRVKQVFQAWTFAHVAFLPITLKSLLLAAKSSIT